MKINNSYYLTDDVLGVANDLIGKVLYTKIGDSLKAGIIVETEAYSYKERACHAFNNRRTKRTETLFSRGGIAYVYLCYGIHNLFNIVTNVQDKAEAVLIRAIEPYLGFSSEELNPKLKLTSGPGKLAKALGITTAHNNLKLDKNEGIWLEDNGFNMTTEQSKRIGVDYAGEDALLPWRFTASGNIWISKGINK